MNARRALVLFDGDCSLCVRAARELSFFDFGRRLELHDLRRADLPGLDARLTLEACASKLHVLEPDGRLSAGFEAVRRLTALLPALWWAAPFLRIPGARRLLEPLYDKITYLRFRLDRHRG